MKKIFVGDFVIGDEGKKAVDDVLLSGRISEGAKTREFEQEFARYIGTEYAVALNSGTSALVAGLSALRHHEKYKDKTGRKVITSPVTYIATSNAIVANGFEPAYADIDKKRILNYA